MKVIHIESGLGNQMLSYAELLVIKKLNPDDECFIETLIYDIPECNSVISQWYGYELERIFGIKEKNIKEIFSEKEWSDILEDIKKTKFWNDGWRYAPAIVNAFSNHGIYLKNLHGDAKKYIKPELSLKSKIMNSRLIYELKRRSRPLYQDIYRKIVDTSSSIFIKSEENIFAGQMLGLRNYGANLDFISQELFNVFVFPEITDERNLAILQQIKRCNSIAVHARRGDMLQSNMYCYKYGYFKRAIKYIRDRVEKPVFFFFCDPDSVMWCKRNQDIFDINIKRDEVYFIDWNIGLEYYRDMQLMSYCKHNIITNSSFGWWGTFFNQNPNKITISPNIWINTKVQL